MRNYKLVLIIKREVDKKDTDAILNEAKSLSGDVKKDNLKELGERKFSYKIKGEQSGNYYIWEFESDKISADLDTKLKNNDKVLRHLLVRVD